MTDFNIINKSLKVACIPLLQSSTDASWKIIPEGALENYGGLPFLLQCNYDIDSLEIDNLPLFYCEILKYWQTKNCL